MCGFTCKKAELLLILLLFMLQPSKMHLTLSSWLLKGNQQQLESPPWGWSGAFLCDSDRHPALWSKPCVNMWVRSSQPHAQCCCLFVCNHDNNAPMHHDPPLRVSMTASGLWFVSFLHYHSSKEGRSQQPLKPDVYIHRIKTRVTFYFPPAIGGISKNFSCFRSVKNTRMTSSEAS